MSKTAKDVVKMGQEVKMVDFRFTDLPGQWQHYTIPAHRLTEAFRRFTSPTCF
jgi:glutamine synthetase